PAPLAKQLEKPLFKAAGDDARAAAGFVVPGGKDRMPASGQAVREVNADGLAAGVSNLKPTFGLNDHLRNPGKGDHRSDRGDGMKQGPVAVETVREAKPRLQAVWQLKPVPLVPRGNCMRIGAWPAAPSAHRKPALDRPRFRCEALVDPTPRNPAHN